MNLKGECGSPTLVVCVAHVEVRHICVYTYIWIGFCANFERETIMKVMCFFLFNLRLLMPSDVRSWGGVAQAGFLRYWVISSPIWTRDRCVCVCVFFFQCVKVFCCCLALCDLGDFGYFQRRRIYNQNTTEYGCEININLSLKTKWMRSQPSTGLFRSRYRNALWPISIYNQIKHAHPRIAEKNGFLALRCVFLVDHRRVFCVRHEYTILAPSGFNVRPPEWTLNKVYTIYIYLFVYIDILNTLLAEMQCGGMTQSICQKVRSNNRRGI